MANQLPHEPYEIILQESLQDEFRVLNAYLPCELKSLSDLLQEEHPCVRCKDGSIHLFKKKELNYLRSITGSEEREALSLPILISVVSDSEMAVLCRTAVEEKVVSKVLDMPIRPGQKKITIYRPQLNSLRKALKTTTQYVFTPTSQ